MKKTIKLFAGITKDNELYFLEIEPNELNEHNKKNGFKPHFSISGFTVEPISEEMGKIIAREYLKDDEPWKNAVESNYTTLGKNDWVDLVLDTDGWEQTLDCSLYPETIKINDKDYSFISSSCGQHKEEELNYYAFSKELFDELMNMWKKYHLKKSTPEIVKRINEIVKEINQDETKEVKKAVIKLIEDGKVD